MKNKTILSVTAGLLLVGCASKPDLATLDSRMQTDLNQLNTEIDAKKMVGHDHLSPSQFEKAIDDKNAALDAAQDGATMDQFSDYISKSRAHLANMEENVKLARVHMDDVLDAREQALKAGAAGSELFKDADSELTELAEEIEERDINEVLEEKDEVKKMFVKAEINAIQDTQLSVAKSNLKKAWDMEGADSFEKELEQVEKNIESAERLIASNRSHSSRFEPAVTKATEMSKQSLALVKTASWLEKSSTRNVTQQLHKDLNSIARPLGTESPQYMSYDQKVSSIEKQASYFPMLKDELTETQLANFSRAGKIDSLQSENQKLSSKVSQNEKFSQKLLEIRKMFPENEAEVLQKGDRLIIRLVGLGFAVGKADIPEDAKPLLSKVGEAIQQINSKDIEIQGHTDSTGGAAINQRLSQKRAMAVNEYLMKNTKVSNKIDPEVRGYGESNPVAVNNSWYGRTQNRRVDIVIDSIQPENLSE